jgi:release factor glutamine methyltransferase
MNILEALHWAEKQIRATHDKKKNTGHNAKLDAQVLLAYVLEKPSSFLFAHFDQTLNETQEHSFQKLVERRTNHEPVAYILGKKEFFGRDFTVNPSVLIPRPDTESMIEIVLGSGISFSTIIDIGTGSGAIAVTLAAELGQPIIAIDIDTDALHIAAHNAKQNKVDHLISFLHGDLLEPYYQKNIIDSGHTLITANLPYLPVSFSQSMDPDVTEYEPNKALYAGVNGLDLYDALLRQIKGHRNKFNKLEVLAEIDASQKHSLPNLIKQYFPEAKIEIHKDLTGRERVIQCFL